MADNATIGLPATIRQGLLNLPGATWETKRTVERLLEDDREKRHCFTNQLGFHNHLSHHLLAAYDLGAPSAVLQKIYNLEDEGLPWNVDHQEGAGPGEPLAEVTVQNWTDWLGDAKHYAGYLRFFTHEIIQRGVGDVLEQYVFAPAANGNESFMLLRFIGGALHPLIQTGYAAEFGSDAMVAQALAQAAVHKAFQPELFELTRPPQPENIAYQAGEPHHRQPSKGHSLLSIIRQAYDSEIMTPVMPYDPDALLSARFRAACTEARRAEIRRLSSLYHVDTARGQLEFDEKVEELIWITTLLLVGSGRRGRKPRLDFFLMHFLNASLFVSSLLAAIPSSESKAALLRALVPTLLIYLTIRGRPRIDAVLAMSYTDTPRPPNASEDLPQPWPASIGDPRNAEDFNPWPSIVASVVHAPDAHTLKAIRTLYYAAQRYGQAPPGSVPGAFDTEGRETHEGIAKVDGSLFVRAAGVVMNTLGWVTHGQSAGQWDRSALGWDDAWKDEK
ncbi:hypothetical protein C8Q78DRAFT_1069524 [Trametes maxima]|nr:hypothetical protein C8Q78DRAFT_1069524 [Trametes maxima]